MDRLFGQIETRTERHPDKLLFSFLDARGCEVERHTYASFFDRVAAIAGYLRGRPDVRRGDRVLLVYPPGLEMICALFGCVGAGVTPVPTHAPAAHAGHSTLVRMENIAKDCSPALLFTNGAGMDLLRRVTAEESGDDAPRPHTVCALEWVDSDALARTNGSDLRLAAPEVFLLQYTSGSTNRPKGVMVSVHNVLSNAATVVDHESPVAVSWLPQHHDMGLLGYYVYILLSGGTTYGFSPTAFIQRPALWLETITRFQGTASSAPNFAFDLCLRPGKVRDSALEGLDLSSLRFLMAAAEPIDVDVFRRFLKRFEPCGLRPKSFFVAYGLAESTLAVSNYGRQAVSLDRRRLTQGFVRPTETVSQIDDAVHLMSCGRPIGDNEVRIVAPDTLLPRGEREIGEIWVKGPSKCLGYWGDEELTQESFYARPDGDDTEESTAYLRTGDMGFLLDGELYVCGRHKDMIIVRGENYFPQDIEAVVQQASGLVRPGAVAAFEVPEDHGSSVVVVAGVRNERSKPDGRAIIAAIRSALNLDIDCIAFVPARSIPKTTSGKLMRYMTKRMWLTGEFTVFDSLRRERDADEPDEATDPASTPLEEVKRRYGLKGDESYSLVEAGIDSIDLVTLLHEVKELIVEKGADSLADQVDVRLIQSVSIAQLFQVIDHIEHIPDDAAARLGHLIEQVRSKHLDEELALMRADTRLDFVPRRHSEPVTKGPVRSVLLSGGTGFLGPFLLRSLLEQTDAEVNVLVRGRSHEEATARLQAAYAGTSHESAPQLDSRVRVVRGDLAAPNLGLGDRQWAALVERVDAVYHNGATVNYLLNYAAMRDVNVLGTSELLRLACDGCPKEFNHVSTTFIFGWATKDVLYESDRNDSLELLDFGYSQSKWVSEQLVFDAGRQGLPTRVFRPALITPSVTGEGANFDITIRLLTFMIKHGIGVSALNQVSFTPADVTARNIVAIAGQPDTAGGTFHVTRDDYANMRDVTDVITEVTGRGFQLFSLPDFVPEVIRRCTRDDLLFPLLDFLVGSISNISSMEFKRYDNSAYRSARDASPFGRPDPSLEDTVKGMLLFLSRHGVV